MGQRYSDQTEIDVLRDIELRVIGVEAAIEQAAKDIREPYLLDVRVNAGGTVAFWSDGSVYTYNSKKQVWQYDHTIPHPWTDPKNPASKGRA